MLESVSIFTTGVIIKSIEKRIEMITVEKVGNTVFPDIKISDGVNSFMIARNNLPDMCWYPEINYFTSTDDITFTIKEEDGIIHALFDKLYQDIIDGNVFPLTKADMENKSLVEIEKLEQAKAKERAKFRREAQERDLIDNGVINWHSEDYDQYEFASILTLKKVDKQITITFSKNKENNDEYFIKNHPTYNVRITESGGRYWPFFVIFANFYHQLQLQELKGLSLTNDLIKIIKK
jgi:hypothetical protein